MVDQIMTDQNNNFDIKINQEWEKVCNQSKIKDTLINNVKRPLDEGNLVAIYNAKADITRLIEEEGTGDNLPKVEFGGG